MRKQQYYRSFDILKFVCAIIIACVYHYKNDFYNVTLFDNIPVLRELTSYGYVLVEIFFIISGFLFFKRYFKKIKEQKLSFTSFMKKRYSRLIFVSGLTIILMFLLEQFYYLKNGSYWLCYSNDLGSLILQLIGIQYWVNAYTLSLNNVVWYISVLLFCYILFFYLSRLVIKKKNIFIFLIPFVISLLVQNYSLNVPLLNYDMTRGIISFSVGVLLGCFTENLKNKKVIFIFSFSNLLLVSLCYALLGRQILGELIFLNVIVYPIIILILICIDDKLKFISSKFTKYLGNISFGIYLWNLPIQLTTVLVKQQFNLNFNYNSINFLLSQIIIHILVAVLSYHLFEKKLIPIFEKMVSKFINYLQKTNEIIT